MRVLYVSFDQVPSLKGATTHILAGLREARRLHRVTLVTLGDSRLPKNSGIDHRPIYIPERNFLRRALIFRDRIAQLLKNERFDLVHFRGPFEGTAAIQSGLPTVYEANALPSIELRYHFGDLPPTVHQALVRWEQVCLGNATRIICPSRRLKECLLQHSPLTPNERIEVLPNGFDAPDDNQFLATAPVERQEDCLRGVYLGTLAPWQGVAWSLKAFRDLAPKFSLDAFAPYQKVQWRRTETRIKRYNLASSVSLRLAVGRPLITPLLAQYDFAIAPLMPTERNSKQGCCPVKVLDYLAAGLPTVVSDLGVVREIIKDDSYPYFYRGGSVLALRQALERVWETRGNQNLRESMQAILAAHPTWDDYSRKLVALYERVATVDSLPIAR